MSSPPLASNKPKNHCHADPLLQLKVDRLAFVSLIEDKGICTDVTSAVASLGDLVPGKKVFGGGYKVGWKAKLESPDGATLHVLFQAAPFWSKRPFLRIEFNPDKACQAGTEAVASLYTELFPDQTAVKSIAMSSYVTRVDAAVDVEGRRTDELVVQAGKMRRVASFHSGRCGETLVYGSSKANQVIVYDKLAEQAAHTNGGTISQQSSKTRIEARRRLNVPLNALPGLPCLFSSVDVADFKDLHHSPDATLLRLFRDSYLLRGRPSALKRLPDPERKQVKDYLAKASAHWWSPNGIWAGWTETLVSSGVIRSDGSSFIEPQWLPPISGQTIGGGMQPPAGATAAG